MMIFLFVGMIASALVARVVFLRNRAGWVPQDLERPAGGTGFYLMESIVNMAALVVSFFLFTWWMPLIALFIGHVMVAPRAVNPDRYAFFYQNQFAIALISLCCSLAIFGIYYGLF